MDSSLINSIICLSKSHKILRTDRKTATIGGGVLVAVPSHYTVSKLSKFSGSKLGFEIITLAIQIDPTTDPFHLSCVYRQPGTTSTEFIEFLGRLLHLSGLILVGDLNYPIDWSLFPLVSTIPNDISPFYDWAIDSGLDQLVKSPTRKDNILDLIFGFPTIVKNCKVLNEYFCEGPLNRSDHRIIVCDFTTPLYPTGSTIQYKDFNAPISPEANLYLSKIDWITEFATCHNPTEAYAKFSEHMDLIIDKFVPSKSSRPSNYYSPSLYRLFRLTERLRAKFERDITDRTTKFAFYFAEKTFLSKKTKEDLRREKTNIENQSVKTFFKFVSGRLRQQDTPQPNTDHNNLDITKLDDGEIANCFASFFCSVFNSSDIDHSLPDCEKLATGTAFHNLPIPVLTEFHIGNYIDKLPNKHTSGVNKLPCSFLKQIKSQISFPLAMIFNNCIFTSEIPPIWKNTYVTPIAKIPNPSSVADFRPISITCSDSKLLEYFIKDTIIEHLQNNDLFSRHQFGFLPGRSTEGNLLSYLHIVSSFLDKSIPVDVLYLDFQKAFDTVIHKLLYKKLKIYNFHPKIIDFIESWLTDRKQSVKFRTSHSNFDNVLSGIPQGSVLGPLLFCIYIHDLVEALNCQRFFYADDGKMLAPILSIHDSSTLQNDLNFISKWCKHNGMALNVFKTKILHMGKNNQCHPYTADGTTVDSVTSIRDLGVIIDSNLTFKPHLDSIINSAIQRSAIISRSFKNYDTKFRLTLFKTFILPIITSCSSVYHLKYQGYRDKLESVQRKYTTYNFKNLEIGALTYQERCNSLKLPFIIDLLKARDLQLLVKLVRGKLYLSVDFVVYNRSNRGHDLKLFKPRHNAASPLEYYFYNRTLEVYNSLPQNMNRCHNLNMLTKFIQHLPQ